MTEEQPGTNEGDEGLDNEVNPAESALDAAEQALSNASEQAAAETGETSEPTPEEQAMLDMAKAAIGNASKDPEPEPTAEEQAMLDMAKAAIGDVTASIASTDDAAAAATPMHLPDLQSEVASKVPEEIALLSDVNLNVKIELGRTRMLVEDILRLSSGAVVELDKLAGDPVDVIVNGRLVARGEVLVLNDSFCVRISEILNSGASQTA